MSSLFSWSRIERRTRLVLLAAVIALVAYVFVLSGDFLIEEVVVIYLIPFMPATIILAISILTARIRRRPVQWERRTRRILVAGTVFNCLVILLMVYATRPRSYDRAEAVADIDFFLKTLEDVHPNLYDRISRETLADSVGAVKNRIAGRIGEHELFKELSRIGSLIEDGHTGNGFSYWMRNGNIFLRRIFPYRLRVEDDRLYVVGNYSYKDKLPAGTEILRVNGLAPADFIRQVGSLLSYETIPYRNTLVANPMWIAIWNDFNGYRLEVQEPSATEVRTINTFGGLFARIQFIRSLGTLGQPYEFKTLADSIGYLGFYQCANLERFTGFLKDMFQQVKNAGTRHLIIDIRENGGGNSALVDELMQYISRKPFRAVDGVQIKVSRETLSRFGEWKELGQHEVGTTFDIGDLPMLPLRPNPLRFDGECILLTGQHTFSSATIFASAYQCAKVGAIVGAETGGITVCYGDVYDFTLPNTDFGFGVSWKRFTHACGVDNRRGVIPDYPVESNYADEQAGRDRVLEFAKELAKKKIAGM